MYLIHNNDTSSRILFVWCSAALGPGEYWAQRSGYNRAEAKARVTDVWSAKGYNVKMKPDIKSQVTKSQVLQAIEDAFHPDQVDPHLNEAEGRVYGSVKVVGSEVFDRLDDIRRQQLLWQNLRDILKADATRVGPVLLEPINREMLEPIKRG